MWGFCDAIRFLRLTAECCFYGTFSFYVILFFSAQHGGLPDSLLKDAFCIVLEGFLNHAQNNSWQRQHLDNMLRMWKVPFFRHYFLLRTLIGKIHVFPFYRPYF